MFTILSLLSLIIRIEDSRSIKFYVKTHSFFNETWTLNLIKAQWQISDKLYQIDSKLLKLNKEIVLSH